VSFTGLGRRGSSVADGIAMSWGSRRRVEDEINECSALRMEGAAKACPQLKAAIWSKLPLRNLTPFHAACHPNAT
jgi:hypothetical protein